MKLLIKTYVPLIVIFLLSGFTAVLGSTVSPFLDFEGGQVYTGYNRVRVPGDTGTKFNLTGDIDSPQVMFFRIRTGVTFFTRHTVSFLAAPLRVNANGMTRDTIVFQQGVFAPEYTEVRFRFDSYRLTYRFDFISNDSLVLGAGLTAKIRDASIRVANKYGSSENKNTGFVPLINFRLQWMFISPFSILIDGDALWAPQGRAEDFQVSLQYHLNQYLTLRAGYRMLEGGADNRKVYTFSLFHYWLIGFTYTF